ncbi:MAG TPA: sulfatase [Armatimonadota bacterium]|nr:sulfatase [Armatimonadota bacterium]HPO73267.1 sulfatase [Armatimonadota bacterium]
MKRKPNLLILGIDSLSAGHMSCYGYPRLTTPYMDRFASEGVLFENTFSPHIPTTPGYACMLTGMDCFNTQIVALRHKGGLRPEVRTLPEILKENGYNTATVQYPFRGFDKVLEYSGWGGDPGGKMPKAENLNKVAIPELDRMADAPEPFFLFLRHLDPHTPYLPPAPYERIFYHGNEYDPENKSMEPVMAFKPFCDYFASWLPGPVTDKDYVIAQYDGAVAYMDAAIQSIFTALEAKGILDDTVVVITADHGETLYEHECWFDHHGTYDNVLHVPLIIRYPEKVPAGLRLSGYNQNWDIVPTILELLDIQVSDYQFDGRSLMDMVRGETPHHDTEFYFTECTWMRKHGWRTPEWKLILALEPDFHFKPPVELYNLLDDPEENNNLAEKEPEVVEFLKARMEAHIAQREKATGLPNPIHHQGDWHGHEGIGAFKSSQQAYDTLHIGNPGEAAKLQARLGGRRRLPGSALPRWRWRGRTSGPA